MIEIDLILEARIQFLLTVGELAGETGDLSVPVTVKCFNEELSFLDPFVNREYLKVLGAGYNPEDKTKRSTLAVASKRRISL